MITVFFSRIIRARIQHVPMYRAQRHICKICWHRNYAWFVKKFLCLVYIYICGDMVIASDVVVNIFYFVVSSNSIVLVNWHIVNFVEICKIVLQSVRILSLFVALLGSFMFLWTFFCSHCTCCLTHEVCRSSVGAAFFVDTFRRIAVTFVHCSSEIRICQLKTLSTLFILHGGLLFLYFIVWVWPSSCS